MAIDPLWADSSSFENPAEKGRLMTREPFVCRRRIFWHPAWKGGRWQHLSSFSGVYHFFLSLRNHVTKITNISNAHLKSGGDYHCPNDFIVECQMYLMSWTFPGK